MRTFPFSALLVLLLVLAGCARQPLPEINFLPPDRPIDYLREVQPVLERRCVVCHSCYNSPCQLKLETFEGLDRGATKKAVYDASRLQTMAPTRLFVDAASTAEWRGKGFFSVSQGEGGCGGSNSAMVRLLALKRDNPLRHLDSFSPETDTLVCPESEEELSAYLRKHPNRGMPYGFPPLSEEQFTLIAGWLAQGMQGPAAEEQAELTAAPAGDRAQIARWEEFLNRPEAKYAMTARYLYEHLFLAHLHFSGQVFYELVRSRTPPGEPIEVIATELPYDDPKTTEFSYRFRRIHGTIVHKTHMVFELSDQRLARFHQLFLEPEWLLPPQRMGYDRKLAANPFRVFEQIPPRSRYQFLLDHIHYIIMTFIHGPVCKGQVALNVIHDHFWLLFLDPAYDLTVRYPGFLQTHGALLEMPLVEGNELRLAKNLFSRTYRHRAAEYVSRRADFYTAHYRYQELDQRAIWRGSTAADTPLLTVFRHFDSASVHRGPLGNLPRTVWVLDYPLIERIYYSLVAGFNVYGSAMHQLATRVYMDELRQEGETYFLDFMPQERRLAMFRGWYGGMDPEKSRLNFSPSSLPAGFAFRSDEPKREFIEYLVDRHFLPESGIAFDRNYLRAGEDYPPMPTAFTSYDDYLQGFKAIARPGVSFFTRVADHNANLAYVRIIVSEREEEDIYLSVVINRWHDDVTTLFGEGLRLRPERDNAVFLDGFIGSYPNYFFEVTVADLADLLAALEHFDGSAAAFARINRYGVNRADPRFWEVFDRFQNRFLADEPLFGGLFDLNRYYHLALAFPPPPGPEEK